MIHGVGIDIIEIKRIENAIQRYGSRFLDRIFTAKEQAYCLRHRESARHFAGRFSAKEAVVKALGTGFRNGISWTDIEIVNDESGKPEASLSSTLRELLGKRFLQPTITISVSHCKEYATAIALCEKQITRSAGSPPAAG